MERLECMCLLDMENIGVSLPPKLQMLDLTESKDPYSSQEDADVTWDELKLSLKQQLDLITSNPTAEE